MNRLKLFVIDDHKLFVEGIVSLLSDIPGFDVVGHALSGKEFLEIIDSVKVDVFLVDINMPVMSGTELTRRIKAHDPGARILVLTMYDDFEYVEKLIQSGASGYVLKSANIQELTQAIEVVGSGKKYFGKDIQELLFTKLGSKPGLYEQEFSRAEDAHLTKREIEILSLIAQEYSSKQIAEKLFISERTVETHRKNIFSKTNAKSVVGLSKYAILHGIIKLD